MGETAGIVHQLEPWLESPIGAHVTRRQLVGDDFCAGLAALERQIIGAGLSSEDFRILICFCGQW